jgi:hypothetical protein
MSMKKSSSEKLFKENKERQDVINRIIARETFRALPGNEQIFIIDGLAKLSLVELKRLESMCDILTVSLEKKKLCGTPILH